jgi:hypothetical protein
MPLTEHKQYEAFDTNVVLLIDHWLAVCLPVSVHQQQQAAAGLHHQHRHPPCNKAAAAAMDQQALVKQAVVQYQHH